MSARIQCEMNATCPLEVTHIGDGGYVYCTPHARLRRDVGYERTRAMRVWEKKLIQEGQPLPSYTPGRKPTTGTENER